MSLRDQLLKSGLANKNQAKKAEKQAKKRQHNDLQVKKDQPDLAIKDEISKDIEEKLQQQKEADRERNKQREEERRRHEASHRAMDLMVSGDSRDRRAEIPYYFLVDAIKIGEIFVNEAQQAQLAKGTLAIVTFDKDYRYFLVDQDCAEKIRECHQSFIVCWHPQEQEKA